MKMMLTVSLLVCAMMVLTKAGDPRPKFCPKGWTTFRGRCFLFVPTAVTWAEAETNCQKRGGHLASLHNFAEHNKIRTMIRIVSGAFPLTWLGGTDAAHEGTWQWTDGTPFNFEFWYPGQPDNYKTAHCLAMNFRDFKQFDDQLCSNRRPYVCANRLC